MEKKIIEKFGNRLRVRVCGILIENNSLLLVRHHYLGRGGILWVPPGGGMEFGTTAEDNLRREFLEETGLEVQIVRYLFLHEFLKPPLHAIELFFEVKRTGGKLIKGKDPEMKNEQQLIDRVEFINIEKLKDFSSLQMHQMLQNIRKKEDILKKEGYFKMENYR